MENYVRRCALYAIIWLVIGIFFCLASSLCSGRPISASDDLSLTQPAVVEGAVTAVLRTRPVRDGGTKLPDEARPNHENAVEPPTMLVAKGATKIVDLQDQPTGASKDATVSKKVVDAPTYEAAPEVLSVTTITKSDAPFYGVGRYATITLTDEQNELLARLIYHECRGIGGAAVAETVFNRMLSREFPSTIEDVIYMENAFSPSGILWTASIDEPEALERCREIPREVLSGNTYLLPSTDYCYFHAGYVTLEGDYEYGGNVFYADYAAHH